MNVLTISEIASARDSEGRSYNGDYPLELGDEMWLPNLSRARVLSVYRGAATLWDGIEYKFCRVADLIPVQLRNAPEPAVQLRSPPLGH